MKLIQCINHHYYDGDTYAACPYCAQTDAAIRTVETEPLAAAESVRLAGVPAETGFSGAGGRNAGLPEAAAQTPWPSSEDKKTISYFARSIGIEPAVGWLVAVGGKYFGEDFRLKAGRNFIGRSPEMDVQLSLDLSVSRRRHAIIVYEPKSRTFIAQPGDSRELFYLNDAVVLDSVPMKDRDIITIGETRLMLVALCGDAFSWEEQEKTP